MLDLLFSTHKDLWADFGTYETISKNQGADAEGLAANSAFLKKLLQVQPSAVLLLTQVRQSVLRVLALDPAINKTSLKNLVFASARFDRISAMLYHLRPAKREPAKWRQLVAKATADGLKSVNELIDMIQQEDKHSNCRAKRSEKPAAEALVPAREKGSKKQKLHESTGRAEAAGQAAKLRCSSGALYRLAPRTKAGLLEDTITKSCSVSCPVSPTLVDCFTGIRPQNDALLKRSGYLLFLPRRCHCR